MARDKLAETASDPGAGAWRNRARKLKDGGDYAGLESLSRERLARYPEDPLGNAYLGYALAGKGDGVAALDALARASQEPKEALPALLMRSKILRELGREEESFGILDQAFKADPSDTPKVLALIRAHMSANRWSAALQLGHHLTANEPKNPASWRVLCETSMGIGNYPEAVEAAGKVLALDPDDTVIARYQALCLSKLGYADQAVQALKTHLKTHGNDRDGWHDLALLEVREGKLEDALVSFRTASELDSANFQTMLAMGTLLAKMGKDDEATRTLETAVKLNPHSTGAHHNLAMLLEKVGRRGEALTEYEAALSSDPGHVASALNRGVLLACLGRLDDARVQLEWATEKDPHSVPILFNLACVYTALGDSYRAYSTLKRLLHHDPFDTEAWVHRGSQLAKSLGVDEKSTLSWITRGEELFARGAFVEAHECFRRALELDARNGTARMRRAQTLAAVYSIPPEDGAAWYRVARMLVELRLLSDAMDAISVLFSVRPRDPDGRVLVGRILLSLEKFQPALSQSDIALRQDARHTGALALRGEALLSLGRTEESLGTFDSLLAIIRDDPTVLTFKGIALCKLRRSEEGLKAFDDALALDPRLREAWYQKGLELEKLGQYTPALEAFSKGFQ